MVDYSNNNINNNKMKKRYHDYIEALEEERKKIQVFHRELPLCLDLVNQAIENCKQQISFSLRSDIEEQTTSTESPVLEEFIPLKRSLSSEEEEEEHQSTKSNDKIGGNKNVDWLKSCQLWNQPPDPPSSKQDLVVTESKKTGGGGAFHPFKKDKIITTPIPIAPKAVTPTLAPTPVPIPASSSTGDNSNKSREDKDAQRKARRCWSPELHRRFLHALQQLGGSHASTPKQIRELMKVDGLTNDEVKSHLQKYRLHTRRPSQSVQTNGNPQPTQFVVVGGIWVPPQEYSAAGTSGGEVTTAAATPKGFYVPVAAQPQPGLTCSQQQQQQKQLQIQGSSPTGSERRSSHSVGNENTHSDSREVTSSSNTITESLAS